VVLRLDAQGRPSRRMFYGPAVDQVLAEERLDYDAESGDLIADEVLWPLADHLGSIRDVAVLDDHGTPNDPGDDSTDIVNHLVYDSFGRITSQTDSGKEPFHTFTGRDRDPLTELSYHRARWYDPAAGKWLSEDPIGFAAGDENLYRYCGNQATGIVDPEGLDYDSAARAVATAEEQLEKVRRLMQQDHVLHEKLLAEVRRYEELNAIANRELTDYLENYWWSWLYGPKLADRVYRLPVTIDGVSADPEYLRELGRQTASQGTSLRKKAEQLDFAAKAIASGASTIATGVVIITVAGVAAASAPVTVTVLGVGALAFAYGHATYQRVAEGQSLGSALASAPVDVVGLADVYGGWTNRDIITGKPLGLTPAERGEKLGCGVGTVVLWIGGGKLFKAAKAAGEGLTAKGWLPKFRELGIREWYLKGAEKDSYWRELSARDKAFYELGQSTLTNQTHDRYAWYTEGLSGRDYVLGAVARGRALWRELPVWSLAKEALTGNWRATLGEGPTPGARALLAWVTPRGLISVAPGLQPTVIVRYPLDYDIE